MSEKAIEEANNESEDGQSFEPEALTDHLRELRSRPIKSFIVILVGFAVSYCFLKPIGTWFFKPLIEVLPATSTLIFTSYQEGFFFI